MAEQKVVTMRLKVDLQCCKCYKKVKKVLCKFPQIREQVFDEKNGIVTIKVVCCDPEKLRDKLCCKGRGSIKSIEIVEPPKPKPKEPEKPKPAPEPEKKKEPEKPKPAPVPPPEKPKEKPPEPEKPKEKPLEPEKPKEKPPAPKPAPPPVPHPCPPPCVPVGICCGPCYEGRPGGPCYKGYGRPPPIYYDGYYGWPVHDSYGGFRPCHVSRCDQYFSDEDPQACTVM